MDDCGICSRCRVKEKRLRPAPVNPKTRKIRSKPGNRASYFDSLLAQNYVDTHDYSFRLIELAPAHPKEVMEQIGTAMMSNTRNGKLCFAHAITHILRVLPVAVVVDWIRKSGIEAMRELAPELPFPFVDNEGSAICAGRRVWHY